MRRVFQSTVVRRGRGGRAREGEGGGAVVCQGFTSPGWRSHWHLWGSSETHEEEIVRKERGGGDERGGEERRKREGG